ncbi:unnamed protein product [Penicillium discolor]
MPDLKASPSELGEISRHSLDSSDPAEAIIADVKHLASYNWIEAPEPTIVVPGSPALCGFVYITQNAVRHPNSPLEPLFRALYIEQPSFDIDSIDVVTDRNNVRQLLSFVNPTQRKNGLDSFTIQVDMTAQTAIFCRAETATYEIIGPSEFRGFGSEFEKSYTINQVMNSTGHYRIISYRLGGLCFLVGHETDGYISDPKPSVKDDLSTGDNLTEILHPLSLTLETTSTVQASVESELTIKREGQAVSRESLEIKTRVFHKPLELSEVTPQLWISQTLQLVRAYHQRGVFSRPEVENVTTAMKDWEKGNQDDIKKLIALVNSILRVTRNWGGSSIIRYDPREDKLVIKQVERKKMLPDDLYSRWNKTVRVNVE